MTMTIEKNLNGSELTVAIVGRLDTTTAPQLEAEFKQNISGVEKLVLDFSSLDYLSSAGLCVLLAAQKVMNKQGEMVIKNVNETINEIFEVTGFIDILTIE
jgi:anti-sigma B factor antagonist